MLIIWYAPKLQERLPREFVEVTSTVRTRYLAILDILAGSTHIGGENVLAIDADDDAGGASSASGAPSSVFDVFLAPTVAVLAVVPCACFLAYNDGLFDWWSLYSIEL